MRLPSVLGIKKRGKDRSKRRRRARKNYKYVTNPKIIGARTKTFITVNPLETAGIVAGGVLAARYGLKSKAYVKRVASAMNNKSNILGKTITLPSMGIGKITPEKVARQKSMVLGAAYLKGLGNAARQDVRKVKRGFDFLFNHRPKINKPSQTK